MKTCLIVLALSIVASFVLWRSGMAGVAAQAPQPPQEQRGEALLPETVQVAGRFVVVAGEGGFVKLDTVTGATWWFTPRSSRWDVIPTGSVDRPSGEVLSALRAKLSVLNTELVELLAKYPEDSRVVIEHQEKIQTVQRMIDTIKDRASDE